MIRKVGVIGAGPSGLTTIKQLRDEGHEVVCFEKNAQIGGIATTVSPVNASTTAIPVPSDTAADKSAATKQLMPASSAR